MVCIGTWESPAVPKEASNEAEEVRRRYDGRAVGPTRSRGVVGAMPGAAAAHSKGLAVE